VPVDVITAQEVIETGHTEVAQILGALAPSFNASHQTIADGSDHINPASLRGLGPDQVLVLVNGKRRHPPALVHVNGTFGRATAASSMSPQNTSIAEPRTAPPPGPVRSSSNPSPAARRRTPTHCAGSTTTPSRASA